MATRPVSVNQYERLSQAAPNWYMDAPELLETVEYYDSKGQHLEAEICLRQALLLHPDNESLKVKKAYFLQAQGRTEEATQLIKTLNASDIDVRFFKAEMALTRFDKAEASHIFEEILANDSQSSPDWALRIDIADCYIGEGYIADAEHVLSEIPEGVAESKRAHIMKAECMSSRQDYVGAQTELNQAIDADPYDADTWAMLGEFQYENQHIGEALEACQYALAINAHHEKALRVSFFALASQKQFEKALEQASIYIEHWPNEYYLPMHAGEFAANLARYKEAIQYLQLANRNCPENHQDRLNIIGNMAQVQTIMGRPDEAFATLQCACSCGSNYAMICVQMAVIAAASNYMAYAGDRLNEIKDLLATNMEVRVAVQEVLQNNPLLYFSCPEVTKELQRLNTTTTQL